MRGQFFTPVGPILLYIVMNDLYNETVERNGKIYHYDPDRDIYYAYTAESTVSQYSWIVLVIILALVCYYVEYIQ